MDRDGRRRGLGNRPSAAGEGHANSGTGESGAEEDGGLAIINKVASLGIVSENGNDLASGKSSCFETVPGGMSGESEEADDARLKLKEMRREEEMAKAKKAMEREKKLAEKHAAKAAIRAPKEAEKKFKEITFETIQDFLNSILTCERNRYSFFTCLTVLSYVCRSGRRRRGRKLRL